MDRIYVSDALYATGGELIAGTENTPIDSVFIDSRKINANSLFIAVPGEHTDGHNYIESAFEKGASCVLVSRDVSVPEGLACIKVNDTVEGLQEISKWYMQKLSIKKLAVTGSVGKTTTRDLLHAALSGKYKTGKNEGNFNNGIGLPLTIMTFNSEMDACVMEMGTMGTLGEIARLAELGKPDVAVITNIGVSHMETLGSRENILKTKMEITTYFTEKNTLIINVDDDKLSSLNREDYPFRIIKVGSRNALCEVDYRISDVCDNGLDGVEFRLEHADETFEIKLPIPGAHNAINAALAIAAANVAGVATEDALNGIALMKTTGSRLRITEVGEYRVIDDSYNAAPASMKSALTTLVKSNGKRKVAVLGDMNELGESSVEMHREVGIFAASSGIDILITVGEKAKDIATGSRMTKPEGKVFECESAEDAYEILQSLVQKDDLVLVKASRGMKLDELVKKLEDKNS